MALITVIIPVYNTAKYLEKCLNSILMQTFTDVEIICINDGSTDDSLEILKQYQKKNSRITIINQNNQGVSAARNAGLEVAAGKYIGFVDSDDSMEKEFFETLYNAAEWHEADIVFSKGLDGTSGIATGKTYPRHDIRKSILPLYFKEDGHNAIWNKLYSAEMVRKYKIIFPVGKTHGEDAEFNIHFLMHATNLYVIDYLGYHYRETEGSATRNAAKFDYLKQAVETFHKDWNSVLGDTITPDTMYRLKKEKLINIVISLIYIYSNPENGLPFKTKIGRLTQIVNHELVQQVFFEDNEEISSVFPRYKKEVYRGIKSRSVIKLYLLSLYSYYRSK